MRIDNKVLALVLAAALGSGLGACQRQEKQPTTGDGALWMRGDPSGALIEQGAGAQKSARPGGRPIVRVRA